MIIRNLIETNFATFEHTADKTVIKTQGLPFDIDSNDADIAYERYWALNKHALDFEFATATTTVHVQCDQDTFSLKVIKEDGLKFVFSNTDKVYSYYVLCYVLWALMPTKTKVGFNKCEWWASRIVKRLKAPLHTPECGSGSFPFTPAATIGYDRMSQLKSYKVADCFLDYEKVGYDFYTAADLIVMILATTSGQIQQFADLSLADICHKVEGHDTEIEAISYRASMAAVFMMQKSGTAIYRNNKLWGSKWSYAWPSFDAMKWLDYAIQYLHELEMQAGGSDYDKISD